MYGKLFSQMYDGTLATKGPWQALVTFQQLIILADQSGVVDMTPESVARRTTIPLEIISQGIKALEEPDPSSRTPALEGRRIVRLSASRDWGWQIVNYDHYRKIRSQEERREYMRKYQASRRAEQKKAPYDVNSSVNNVSNVNQSSKQYADAISRKHIGPTNRRHRLPADFEIDQTGLQKAKDAGINTALEFQAFKDFHSAKGSTMLDWQAAWRTWVTNAVKFSRGKSNDSRKRTIRQLTGYDSDAIEAVPTRND